MKTTKHIGNGLILTTLILAVAAVAWLPGSVRADGMKPMKGAEHLMMLNKLTTPEQAETLKPGDTIAMACPKCQTIMVERVTTEKGHKITTPGEKHLCTGCQTTIVTVGTGKNSHNELKHVCNACGSEDVFCCATSTNAAPTMGMEEKK